MVVAANAPRLTQPTSTTQQQPFFLGRQQAIKLPRKRNIHFQAFCYIFGHLVFHPSSGKTSATFASCSSVMGFLLNFFRCTFMENRPPGPLKLSFQLQPCFQPTHWRGRRYIPGKKGRLTIKDQITSKPRSLCTKAINTITNDFDNESTDNGISVLECGALCSVVHAFNIWVCQRFLWLCLRELFCHACFLFLVYLCS